ncbi:MAG: hypothetical protein KAQ62_16940, partial [Cyclobacteriaceae bacterium]|nr:hypothetical protein [Cyclobacteriaceae bacterium]
MSLILLVSACTSPDKGTTTLLEFVNSDDTGIDFRNDIAEDLNNNVFAYTNFYNGGGVAVGDINNDGLADI